MIVLDTRLAGREHAWRLRPRDEWIGWSEAARREHLQEVVNNSRFLIVPSVRVPHLASHVLGRCLQRLRVDWEERYGYAPVLAATFIEVYYRTLKSGCRIEDRRLATADRIEACLAIDMVVAWRVYLLTQQGRETPDVPCDIYLNQDEWQALCACTTRQLPPSTPPPLQQAVRMIAKLGGFLGRKSDGLPGTTTLWRGLQRLTDITFGFGTARAAYSARGP